ncbi:zinc transporter ZIP13-like isoform X1 [Artemia franciscana]|uniref:Zinc transporter ZIP13 n=1 Tax=Artemia franciscana TaxID=6661 RepID=A0AA88IWA0_ARTSF|nr:hypothetical protein QYM36_008238 [Artemia franciscana]
MDEMSYYQPWIFSIAASLIVGLSGVLPMLVIPMESGVKLKNPGNNSRKMRRLLSFAVGGLLGDVFLHLLPEAWEKAQYRQNGGYEILFWVLVGLTAFGIIEKMLSSTENMYDSKKIEEDVSVNNNSGEKLAVDSISKKARVAGYLNLVANSIDNFTHGLAVGGSFLVSTRVGCLTTLAILLHEVPHEVADFAILLRSGFTRWEAAQAQFSTALIGLAGSLTALGVDLGDKLGERTAWILPFTAGGFLNIALFNVLPELIETIHPNTLISDVSSFISGLSVMAAVSYFLE